MKRSWIIAPVFGMMLMGCKKDGAYTTSQKLTAHPWKITSILSENGKTTSIENGDLYRFNENGELIIQGDKSIQGTWRVNPARDETLEYQSLLFNFSSKDDTFSGNWYILSEDNDVIQLEKEPQDNKIGLTTIITLSTVQ